MQIRQPKRFHQHDEEIFHQPVKMIGKHFDNELLISIMQDLVNTHFQHPLKVGVGLAGNQVGHPYSIFLTYINLERAQRENCKPHDMTFWLNASFKPCDDALPRHADEGCFSIVGKIAENVPRFSKIRLYGEKIRVTLTDDKKITAVTRRQVEGDIFEGFLARVMQHECDHVNNDSPKFIYHYNEHGVKGLKDMSETHDPRTRDSNHSDDEDENNALFGLGGR